MHFPPKVNKGKEEEMGNSREGFIRLLPEVDIDFHV